MGWFLDLLTEQITSSTPTTMMPNQRHAVSDEKKYIMRFITEFFSTKQPGFEQIAGSSGHSGCQGFLLSGGGEGAERLEDLEYNRVFTVCRFQ